MLDIVLLLLAVVLFGLAAFRVAASRIDLVAAGLFCFALVPLLHAIGA
jgi:hypothetical protein